MSDLGAPPYPPASTTGSPRASGRITISPVLPPPPSFFAAPTLPPASPPSPHPELSLLGFLSPSLLPGYFAPSGCLQRPQKARSPLEWAALWSHTAPGPGPGALGVLGRRRGVGGGQLCLQSFRLPESRTRTLCCCCFKKRSLLVKPTADNFNALSCWAQTRRSGGGGGLWRGAEQCSRVSSP